MTKIEMQELASLIHEVVLRLDASEIGFVNLGHHFFDRMPCSRRRLYAVVRKYASEWGYEYHGASYQASGNRAFARVSAEKQAYRSAPSLYATRRGK